MYYILYIFVYGKRSPTWFWVIAQKFHSEQVTGRLNHNVVQ